MSTGAPMNFVTFNQDYTCLAIGTHNGYRIYSCEPFGKIYENKEGDVSVIEMLFSTSLVALIYSPRRLVITNTKVCAITAGPPLEKDVSLLVCSSGLFSLLGANGQRMSQRQTTICELTFPTKILSVKLNRKRLVVVLEEQIYVYDISNMNLLHTIETSPNPNGKLVFIRIEISGSGLMFGSHLRALALFGTMLHCLPPANFHWCLSVHTSLACSPQYQRRPSNIWRRPPLRRYQTRSRQRRGSAQITTLLCRPQQ